jgi:hypothetical protein
MRRIFPVVLSMLLGARSIDPLQRVHTQTDAQLMP